MAKRGGVQARNYVLHIKHGRMTRCGRKAADVNCFAGIQDSAAAVQEQCCKRCAARVALNNVYQYGALG